MLSRHLFELSDRFCKVAAKPKLKAKFPFTIFPDGIAINADSTDPETMEFVKKYLDGKKIQLMHVDPPYFVLPKTFQKDKVDWDQTDMNQQQTSDWMKSWVKLYLPLMYSRAALYIWGGTGTPGFRPFFVFCSQIEHDSDVKLTVANVITWRKKRAFGVKNNYLYTREECVYLVNSDENNPRVFHIPLTNIERGYGGFGKYKAKSKFLRRTNIWDITELFSGKVHPTEKKLDVVLIPIEASSNKGDFVLDLFGGSFSTAVAARKLGRKFIIIEKDKTYYKNGVKRLQEMPKSQ